MVRRISASLVILWLAIHCLTLTGAQVNTKDEPLVYAAAIEELFAGKKISDKPIKALLLESLTRFDDFEGEKAVNSVQAGAFAFKGLKPETMQSFLSQNAQRGPVTNAIKVSLK